MDADKVLTHVPIEEFPAQTLTCELYLEAGIRACEIGYILADRDPVTRENRFGGLDLVRLCIPHDISFLVDSMGKWDEIYATIMGAKGGDSLLKDVRFVDEYKGKQVPEGKKSITVRLVICSDAKTLTGSDIEAVANSAMKKLTKQLGVEFRTV